MTTFIIFSLLLISLFFVILTGMILTISLIIKKRKGHAIRKTIIHLKRNGVILCVLVIGMFGLSLFSQVTAQTPAILDEQGKIKSGSISELTQIELNGRKEWISIRGQNAKNPVLLFLAGGPGGSQMAAVRHDLAALEKDFVVVNWDQPGSGKSFYTTNKNNLTVANYIDDGSDLTEYLCQRFAQEKIYLLGESWGSALAIFLADQSPDRYHAVIGTGQMIDFLETEIIDYNLALEIAQEKNDTAKIDKLLANGSPPYYGKDVTLKSAAYLTYLTSYMGENPAIYNNGYNTLRDIFSPEYSLLDKINFFRGIISTFNHVYPQLYNTDLRQSYQNLDVPIYFFLGRHDLNAPTSLVEDYVTILNAPVKKIVWFEHSGHSPWINESDAFVEELLQIKNTVNK
ncbi:MAG: alpha/beta hydrolase [Firmicutes bacterium HGW-Firmicutes-4]|jgi:pimeloyl-ACP methyl ester carboxylesterase|nr:MAG: alpha/beta hydrolase [Firmicutes bacterium HGW-Firmicutes-4]